MGRFSTNNVEYLRRVLHFVKWNKKGPVIKRVFLHVALVTMYAMQSMAQIYLYDSTQSEGRNHGRMETALLRIEQKIENHRQAKDHHGLAVALNTKGMLLQLMSGCMHSTIK